MTFLGASFRQVLMAGLLPAVLSACDTPVPDAGVVNRLSAPYVEAQHQYRFAGNAASLSGAERRKISDFLRKLAPQEGDYLLVTVPSSGSGQVDASRLRMMQAAMAQVPARKDFSMTKSFGQRLAPTSGAGILRLTRAEGIRVDCQPGLEELGCANAVNLAAMIHEPGDVLGSDATASMAYRQIAP